MSTVILSKTSGNGNGKFTVIPDTPNNTPFPIYKTVKVVRKDKVYTLIRICQNGNAGVDYRDTYVFYPSETRNGLTWSTYTNSGINPAGINDNWKSNGVTQKGLGLSMDKPFIMVLNKDNSYSKSFFICSYKEDNSDVAWTCDTVKDAGIRISITPVSGNGVTNVTVTSEGGAMEEELSHTYRFFQPDTNLEFYVKVIIMPEIEHEDSDLESVSMDDIVMEVGESVSILDYIHTVPADFDFTLENIQRVVLDNDIDFEYNSETGIIKSIGTTTAIANITLYTTDGKIVVAGILANASETEPVTEQHTLLLTYTWDAPIEDALDTVTYIYGDEGDYVTDGSTSELKEPANRSGKVESVEEFYGVVSGPSLWEMSDGGLGKINATSTPYVITETDKPTINWIESKDGYTEQVLIVLGDKNSPYGAVRHLSSDENWDGRMFIDMFANWHKTSNTPDHDGKDDGRQILGKITSVKAQLYKRADFAIDSQNNLFVPSSSNQELVIEYTNNTAKKGWTLDSNPFQIGAADSLNAVDPKKYFSSLARIMYNSNTQKFEMTDMRTRTDGDGKTAGIITEFYPEANYGSGEGDSVVSKWCGGRVNVDNDTDEGIETSNGGSPREFVITGINSQEPWVPVRIHSSLILPSNTDTFWSDFNDSTDLQEFAHQAQGFTIKPLWCNESSKHVAVYNCASVSDMSEETLIGQVYPDDTNWQDYTGLHIENNVSDDSQYVDLLFSLEGCKTDDFELGKQQAAPWRYVDLVLEQDNSPEVIHLSFRLEDPRYIAGTLNEKTVLWPGMNANTELDVHDARLLCAGHPFERNETDITQRTAAYWPSAASSLGHIIKAPYASYEMIFHGQEGVTGAVNNPALEEVPGAEHTLFPNWITKDGSVQAKDLYIIKAPVNTGGWLHFGEECSESTGSTAGEIIGEVTVDSNTGEVFNHKTLPYSVDQNTLVPRAINTMNNQLIYPIGGNNFMVEYYTTMSTTPHLEREMYDVLCWQFDANDSPLVRKDTLYVTSYNDNMTTGDYEAMEEAIDDAITAAGSNFAQTAEGVIPFNVWQGGTYKVTFTVEQRIGNFIPIMPIGWDPTQPNPGVQTAWRSFMLQGDNSTYQRPESAFCTGNDSETSADEFSLSGVGLHGDNAEDFIQNQTNEEKCRAKIIPHIYKMNDSGEYEELSSNEKIDNVEIYEPSVSGGSDWATGDVTVIDLAYPYSLEDRNVGVQFKIRLNRGTAANPDWMSLGRFNVNLHIGKDHAPNYGPIVDP